MPAHPLTADRAAPAADRILDAAGRCYAAKGLAATSISDIATEAGCSRPTVYRWFDDGAALRAAFVHREARRVGAAVRAAIEPVGDPRARFVQAVQAALAEVRARPPLAAWFTGGDAGAAASVAGTSGLIESLVVPFVGGSDDELARQRARWVVRIVLSLLAMPGADDAEERQLIERFLTPVVVAPARPRRAGATARRRA